jgi:hypothetical protein
VSLTHFIGQSPAFVYEPRGIIYALPGWRSLTVAVQKGALIPNLLPNSARRRMALFQLRAKRLRV